MQNAGSPDIQKAFALFHAGNMAATAQACKAILQRNGRDVPALHLLAMTAMQQRDFAGAERVFAKLIKVEPNSAKIWTNRGRNFAGMNMFDRALEAFDRAVAIAPNSAELWADRGRVLIAKNMFDRALEAFDRALAIKPAFPQVLYNRAKLLNDMERFDEALAAYDKCLELVPQSADALTNRANVLVKLERNEEALASYNKCIAVAPHFATVWKNLGMLLVKMNQHERAERALGTALQLDPQNEDVICYLASQRQQLCDWDDLSALISKVSDYVRKGRRVLTPFVLIAATDSSRLQLQCARDYVAKEYPPAARPLWQGERYAHERIRIAYLSGDFRNHPVAFLTAGLFECHDRTKFETIAISFTPENSDEMEKRIRGAFDKFIDVRKMSDRDVANLIRELEVDIAIDLMGPTEHCCLGVLAFRPAPIQVNYLGYPATIGAGYIDYIIADPYLVPASQRPGYSEYIAYLPDTFQANDAKRPLPACTVNRVEIGLPERGFVFCAFNNPAKITPAVFDVWMRLLRRVENSVLWLFADTAASEQNLRREAAARGIAPDRLVLAPRVEYHDYLARYRLADLFLDTFPFNGGTTASDALWAGLPVVTCSGEAFASRMAGSLLNAIGLPELITNSLADYESLAHKLATDPGMLADIRARLSQNRTTCPLFDTDRFRRHLESAFTAMYERHQRGEPPADISVCRVERDENAFRSNVMQSAMKDSRTDMAALAAQYFASDPRPIIVMLLHQWGGGTETHVRSLAAMLGSEAIFLMLKPAGEHKFALSALNMEDGPKVEFQLEDWSHVCTVLHSFGVRRVHVHHTLGFFYDAKFMLRQLNVPYDLTIHDFMLVCPRLFLYRNDVGYCGEPNVAGCLQCLREKPPGLSEDILRWRQFGREMIEGAERVICPSQDAAARIGRYASRENLVVVPHEGRTAFMDRRVRIPPLASSDRMRVAVLGILAAHKGARFLLDCAALWKAADVKTDVTLIGESQLPGVRNLVHVTGSYQETQLPDLIANLNPHLILYPQKSPETYSYTLSEGLRAGVPILVPDLGAFRERTEGMDWCWLYDPADSPLALTELLRRIRVEHLEMNTPPPVTSGLLRTPVRETNWDFYQNDYLAAYRSTK
jgi:predicted O-linked N-acetylglucosamine transferase (SPINDLY family)